MDLVPTDPAALAVVTTAALEQAASPDRRGRRRQRRCSNCARAFRREGFDDRVIERDGDLGGGAGLPAVRAYSVNSARSIDRPYFARFGRHLVDQPAHLPEPPVEAGVVAVPAVMEVPTMTLRGGRS